MVSAVQLPLFHNITLSKESFHLVPAQSASSSNSVSVKKVSGEIAVHDTLRNGPRSLATEINDVNPLKGRLDNACTTLSVSPSIDEFV